MTIEKIDVNVCSPGRNFVTLKIVTSDGVVGWGDATLNGRELVGRRLPVRAPGIDADRPRRRPHRGHLAVPVPRRLLAARACHHGRHRRRRHGVVGHQGQEGRGAALPAARWREPRPHSGVRSRLRPRLRRPQRRHQRLHRRRLHRCASADRRARTRTDLRCRHQQARRSLRLRTGPPRGRRQCGHRPDRRDLGYPGVPVAHARDLLADPRRLRNRRAGPTRRASPDDPHRGGPIRQRR